jgi:hypothetical protein
VDYTYGEGTAGPHAAISLSGGSVLGYMAFEKLLG